MILITGGSGSGKSEYAEKIALSFREKFYFKNMIYIATMFPEGGEALEKIERHREMRKGKGFFTKECYKTEDIVKISYSDISEESVVLLECMSNLLANEIFLFKNKNAYDDIIKAMKVVSEKSGGFIIVTNDVFSDGIEYDKETLKYIKCLAEINRILVDLAEDVVEVVCGIPVYMVKQFEKEQNKIR